MSDHVTTKATSLCEGVPSTHLYYCQTLCDAPINARVIEFSGNTLTCKFPNRNQIAATPSSLFFFKGDGGNTTQMGNLGTYTDFQDFGAHAVTWCSGNESSKIPHSSGDDCVAISDNTNDYKFFGNYTLPDQELEKGTTVNIHGSITQCAHDSTTPEYPTGHDAQTGDRDDALICGCPSGNVPLGPTYDASQLGGRIASGINPSVLGQCLDKKIVACLYLDASSVYALDGPAPRCTVGPDSYEWMDDQWVVIDTTPDEADLSLFKTATPSSVNIGETISYTLTYKNNGPDEAQGIAIADAYNKNKIDIDPQSIVAPGWTCQNNPAESQLNCVFDASTMESSVEGTITYTATALQGIQAVNTAVISSSTPEPNLSTSMLNNASKTTTIITTSDCPHGSKLSGGACIPCGTGDEGKTDCCGGEFLWWHQDPSPNGACFPPKEYECKVVIPNTRRPEVAFQGVTFDYGGTGNAPVFASPTTYRSANKSCKIDCNDVLTLPTNTQWKHGASRLSLSPSSTPPFYEVGTTTSCQWECASGYILNESNFCVEDNRLPDNPPGGNSTPPPPDDNAPQHPELPLVNVTGGIAGGYAALTQRQPDHWQNDDYFLSPVKDGVSDVKLRFRISEKPENSTWNTQDTAPLVKWKIVATNHGISRTLTGLSDCASNDGVGGSLCISHFYNATGYGRVSDTEIFLTDPQGIDSLTGEIRTITDFLDHVPSTEDPLPEFPRFEIRMLSAVKDAFGKTLVPSVDYQIFIKSFDTTRSTLPGSLFKRTRAAAEIGGFKQSYEFTGGGESGLPFTQYTFFN